MSMVLHDNVGELSFPQNSLMSCELNNSIEGISNDSSERCPIPFVTMDDSFYTEFIESVLSAGPTVHSRRSDDINPINGINT